MLIPSFLALLLFAKEFVIYFWFNRNRLYFANAAARGFPKAFMSTGHFAFKCNLERNIGPGGFDKCGYASVALASDNPEYYLLKFLRLFGTAVWSKP